jgi:pimeloyl-ACP methyl ester carboxylesterase
VLTEKINEIGAALPQNALYKKSTLFIRGGNSDYILEADVIEIKNHFPQMTLETIPDTGHWLHAENAPLFVDKTVQFLKQ